MRLLALVKSFPVIQIKEIRPVVMAVLKNMSYIEDRQDFHIFQCCGSGSGSRCLFDPWIRDLGGVKKQDPDPGWGKSDPGSG
jgi:hypothetical protein